MKGIYPTRCGAHEVAGGAPWRILRMILGSSMEAMTRMGFLHRGQTSGSVSYTFRIKRDQFLLTSLEQRSDSSTVGIANRAGNNSDSFSPGLLQAHCVVSDN